MILFIDFETYYSTADKYSLKCMSMLEYIRSPQYKSFGFAYKWAGQERAHWISGDHAIRAFMGSVDWHKVEVCAQNVKFDGAILSWIYGVSPARYIDTLSMSRAVLGCRLQSHSLAAITNHLQLSPKGFLKTDGFSVLTPEQEHELAEYCIHDVELCETIYNRLAAHFPVSQYPVMDWTVRCFIQPELQLDAAVLAQTHEQEKARRADIFKEIGLEKKFFASNAQFPKLLEKRGYEVPMKKSPTTGRQIPALALSDAGFIDMQNSGSPELEALCEARIAAKSTLLETRSAKFLEISKLGSFPFDLNFSGAVNTHRFSGANGAGGNPQNLPRGSALRGAITAPTGYALVVADFSAIELRIVAWLAREPKLIDVLMDRAGDPYSQFATKIYHRPITKADKKERQYGKCAVLGLGYNMGAKKFTFQARNQAGVVIDQEEAERVVYLYRDYYSRVPLLWRTLDHYIPYIARGAQVKLPGMPFLEIRDGCVYLPSGLRIQYPNLRQEDDEWIFDTKGSTSKLYGGKLLENISQALAGEICKEAITRALNAGINCKGQVHDEVLAVVKEEDAPATKCALIAIMEAPLSWWSTIKLYAEGGYGKNWLGAKP